MANSKTPLRWVKREVAPANRSRLKVLQSRFTAKTEAIEVAAAATHELPDLSAFPAPVDKVIRLLQSAAAVEHALMVQYLYTGYGFTAANRDILNIAVEEMSHLMTVQNLLKLVGSPPDLNRQDFGTPASDEERIFPFPLLFAPVSNVTLARYVLAESPEDTGAAVPPALMARIVDLAMQGATMTVNRVGTLYALLGAAFGTEQVLLQKAATGDPWYIAMNALAAEAAVAFGGRDKLHLPDAAFLPASLPEQSSDREWDHAVFQGTDSFRVHVAATRDEALEALRDIGLQGEGPSTVSTETSHFQRFLTLFKTFFGSDGMGTTPVSGAASVPRAAHILVDPSATDPEAIAHPNTVPWARLADHRYAILLGSLEKYLTLPAVDRGFLTGWCFAEMFALKRLASFLVQRPRSGTAGAIERAAIPFNLPAWAGTPVSWGNLETAFTAARQENTTIRAAGGLSDVEACFLQQLAVADADKLAEVQARAAGTTVRTKFHRAREILDRLAGAGNPHHNGDSPTFPSQDLGRFWNQSLADFKATVVGGEAVVALPGSGLDPALIDKLRTKAMPRFRPKIDTTDPDFAFLEAWILNGCPDEPV